MSSTHDVFLSYASADKTVADMACAVLERQGVRVWIAPRDVLAGADYPAQLTAAIENASVLVAVWSEHFDASQHTKREVEIAVSLGKHVLPLRIADVPMDASSRYLFAGKHWLDAITPPIEEHLAKLASTVKALLGGATASRPSLTARPAHGSRRAMIVIATIAVAATLTWFAMRPPGRSGESAPQKPVPVIELGDDPRPASVIASGMERLRELLADAHHPSELAGDVATLEQRWGSLRAVAWSLATRSEVALESQALSARFTDVERRARLAADATSNRLVHSRLAQIDTDLERLRARWSETKRPVPRTVESALAVATQVSELRASTFGRSDRDRAMVEVEGLARTVEIGLREAVSRDAPPATDTLRDRIASWTGREIPTVWMRTLGDARRADRRDWRIESVEGDIVRIATNPDRPQELANANLHADSFEVPLPAYARDRDFTSALRFAPAEVPHDVSAGTLAGRFQLLTAAAPKASTWFLLDLEPGLVLASSLASNLREPSGDSTAIEGGSVGLDPFTGSDVQIPVGTRTKEQVFTMHGSMCVPDRYGRRARPGSSVTISVDGATKFSEVVGDRMRVDFAAEVPADALHVQLVAKPRSGEAFTAVWNCVWLEPKR